MSYQKNTPQLTVCLSRHLPSVDAQADVPEKSPLDLSDHDHIAPSTEAPREILQEYPSGFSLFFICFGLFLGVLCTGLDRLIIATAIPKIAAEFDSLPDIGWYGSAYLLTGCSFQLMFGKLFAEFSIKWLFLGMLGVFEVGSILCAAAPNSPVLIVGRAVAGLGAVGVLTGALIILTHTVPLHNRPKVTSAIGSSIGIAQIIAPTIGGAFADYVTWRWCFWLNLPLGGVTFLVVVFLVHLPASATRSRSASSPRTARQVLGKLDLPGTIFLLPAIISLLLALQWGGSIYPWSNWRVILTLTIFGVAILIWGFIQYRRGDDATVPVRIIKMRSMATAAWFSFALFGMLFPLIQFIPLWFQAVLDTSANQSGVNFLAITVPLSVVAIISGFMTSKIGYYVPQMITSTVFMSVAAGLITRFGVDTTQGYWIGSLVLLGIGAGIGGQQSLMVPQTVLFGGDIAIGTSLVIFAQTLSGTVWLSVANNVFQDHLVHELAIRAPAADPQVVLSTGGSAVAESIRKIYPELVDQIVASYSDALKQVWLISVVLACLSVFGSVLQEWVSVKKDKEKDAKRGTGSPSSTTPEA
ncbi:major facilitator superfamily domain-containing protein [Apodospora peruviana]|uniref:Major facilitator superfamily domain-containing protein n=1 Tax=Apodospora peruviana TaxID=516989 RepID=A0AAE0M3Y4_9PEZI|nr:major facilitator superfamily domain-containing protein [Apodospora peruviana]